MDLIIVESPSKAKTISKYLKGKYRVDASGGHIRDLPQKMLGVSVKNNFEPKYVTSPGKEDTIRRLTEEAAKADRVYLATDPDREGEAISWHLQTVLGLPEEGENRIEFNEISPKAVETALRHPRKIDYNLVDAQQARRVLDRLVGYKLSPLLNNKIRNGLSAGRVQSVALRLVVDREREIAAFVPEEYWTITAELQDKEKKFSPFRAALEKRGMRPFLGAEVRVYDPEDYFTEFLLYGFDKVFFYDNPPLYTLTQRELFELCDGAGVFMAQSHPFRSKIKLGYYAYMHGAEVFNGHPRPNNRNPLAELFAESYDLKKIAGSDFHEVEFVPNAGILVPENIDTDGALKAFLFAEQPALIKDGKIG